jgi:hypothetical protein
VVQRSEWTHCVGRRVTFCWVFEHGGPRLGGIVGVSLIPTLGWEGALLARGLVAC